MFEEDILNVGKLWINGKCYRNYETNGCISIVEDDTPKDSQLPEMQELSMEEPCDDDYNIEVDKWGKFRLQLPIPSELYGFLIGKGGVSLRRLEDVSSTKIELPKLKTNMPVCVIGRTRGDVLRAKKEIDSVLAYARRKLTMTHFVSIPINAPEIIENVETFKKSVLRECASKDICEENLNMFIHPNRLHLTICVLVLLNEYERNIVKEILKNALDEIIRPKIGNETINLALSGIDILNDDPTETNVIFAKVKSPEVIQAIANEINEKMLETGFVKDDRRATVKLHVTLINTRKLEDDASPKKYLKFDATNILKKFKDFHFGLQPFKELHLSQTGNEDITVYYKPALVIKVE